MKGRNMKINKADVAKLVELIHLKEEVEVEAGNILREHIQWGLTVGSLLGLVDVTIDLNNIEN